MKPIKFDLRMNDAKVSTLEALQENFTAEILPVFQSGKLSKWLKSRDLLEQAAAIDAIDKNASELQQLKAICQVLGLDDDEDVLQFLLDDATIQPTPAPPSVQASEDKTDDIQPLQTTGVDWSGQDMSGRQFIGENLRNANLKGTSFSGADLSQADLSGANLEEANLSCSNLSQAKLTGANLESANLSEAKLHKANFYEANLTKANLSRAKTEATNFTQANLTNAKLDNGSFDKCNFSEANLTRASVVKAKLFDTNFTKADLSFSNFTGSIFYESDDEVPEGISGLFDRLRQAELSKKGKVNLTGSKLTGVVNLNRPTGK